MSIINPDPERLDFALDVDAQGHLVLSVRDPFGGQVHQVILSDDTRERLTKEAAALLGQGPTRETDMEVQVSAFRYANYGDHAQMDHRALAYDPTETVEALVLRGLKLQETYGRSESVDHIVLRVVEGTEPERVGSDVPPF